MQARSRGSTQIQVPALQIPLGTLVPLLASFGTRYLYDNTGTLQSRWQAQRPLCTQRSGCAVRRQAERDAGRAAVRRLPVERRSTKLLGFCDQNATDSNLTFVHSLALSP
eukprot:6085419-Pleurochrysis_carterae.AAC.1